MTRGPHPGETRAKNMELRADSAYVLRTPILPGMELRLAQRQKRVDVFFARAF